MRATSNQGDRREKEEEEVQREKERREHANYKTSKREEDIQLDSI